MKRLNDIAQVAAFAVLAVVILLSCVVMSPFLRLQEWLGGGR